MGSICIQYYKSPAGELILGSYEGKLCLADWRYRKSRTAVDNRLQKGLKATYVEVDTELLILAREQLVEYFCGDRQTFDLPLLPVGTEFQKSVWKGLLKIPFGQTVSYLALAKTIDSEKAVRAVAAAVGANALSLFIPCHRIIGSDGSLTGYAGGLEAKQRFLDLELANYKLKKT